MPVFPCTLPDTEYNIGASLSESLGVGSTSLTIPIDEAAPVSETLGCVRDALALPDSITVGGLLLQLPLFCGTFVAAGAGGDPEPDL